jgi:hypothetical protein
VNGEGGIDPDLVGVFAQEPSTDTVERSSPGQRIDDGAGAAAHNLSCDRSTRRVISAAARKGHQQDPAGIGTIDDQMRDPMGHGVGLPRIRAGDDQERGARRSVVRVDGMLDGSSLLTVEGLKIGDSHQWQIGLQ